MQSEEETWSQEFLLAFPAGEQTTQSKENWNNTSHDIFMYIQYQPAATECVTFDFGAIQ